MALNRPSSNYTQGYSANTIATHRSRTVESDASYLLPYLKKEDHILDVGCGPGTITTGLARFACEGRTVGIDISTKVLRNAKSLAAGSNMPMQGPGCVILEEGNILEKLCYPDGSFDVVFSSQLFGHLPPPDLPLRALAEMRRVLKPGGILATRDTSHQHFYPQSLELDRLRARNLGHVLRKGSPGTEFMGTSMSGLFRRAGFIVEDGKVRVGAGTTVHSDITSRKWLARSLELRLQPGDPLYQSWLDAGIGEDEILETRLTLGTWAETQDAWFAALHREMIGWK